MCTTLVRLWACNSGALNLSDIAISWLERARSILFGYVDESGGLIGERKFIGPMDRSRSDSSSQVATRVEGNHAAPRPFASKVSAHPHSAH